MTEYSTVRPLPVALPRGNWLDWLSFLPGFHTPDVQCHLEDAHRGIFKGDFAAALSAYERALKVDPHCAKAHQGVAMLLVRKGRLGLLRKALAHVMEAVAQDPYDAHNYRINAEIYLLLGMRRRARAELRAVAVAETVKRHPNHPVANNQMGVLLLRQFRMDQALVHFQRAVAADPRCEVALRNLARLYYIQADSTTDPHTRTQLLAAASDHVQQALAVAPTAAAWTVLARIRLLAGNPREALDAVEAAEKLDPGCRDLAEVRYEARMVNIPAHESPNA